MQTQHLIIIAILFPLSWALLGYFIWRAALRIERRHFANLIHANSLQHSQITDELKLEIRRLSRLRREDQAKNLNEIQQTEARMTALHDQVLMVRAAPFTNADHAALIDAAHMLELAARVWTAMGIPTASKATRHQQQLIQMAHRIRRYLQSGKDLNGVSLDTQLIDWLNKHGSLWGGLETTTMSIPHVANSEGYPHVREALRDARDQHLQRVTAEMTTVEDAA